MTAKVIELKPMPGKVVVELMRPAEKTVGGLIIPANAREEMNQARVVSVCEATEIDGQPIESLLNVGDYVIFSRFVGTKVTFSNARDKEFWIIRETDILSRVVYDFSDGTEVEPDAQPEVSTGIGEDPRSVING